MIHKCSEGGHERVIETEKDTGEQVLQTDKQKHISQYFMYLFDFICILF